MFAACSKTSHAGFHNHTTGKFFGAAFLRPRPPAYSGLLGDWTLTKQDLCCRLFFPAWAFGGQTRAVSRCSLSLSLIWSDLIVCRTVTLAQRITSVIEGKIGVDSESLRCKSILPRPSGSEHLPAALIERCFKRCVHISGLVLVSCFSLFDPLRGFFSL